MKNSQKWFVILAVLILLISTGITCFSAARLMEVDNKVEDVENNLENLAESGQKETKGQEVRDLKCERDKIDKTDKADKAEQSSETQMESLKDESETEAAGTNGMTEVGETETETEFTNGYTIGIDPGHQGSWVDMSEQEPDGPGSGNYKPKASSGTTGRFTGVPEYELNLDISLALRDELEHRGYRVVMTREDNDTAISNAERALKAADEGSDIYVRIHANGSDNSSVSGALGMTPSPENPYVANLYEDSYRLTGSILNAYCEATGFANLGIQYYDNMTGINWSKVPVTILEMGFMTNEKDDYAMQEDEMQRLMVKGIADGIDQYFEQ